MNDWYALVRTVQPTIEPVTLEEARQHLAASQVDDDLLIVGWIRAAREAAEVYLGRAILTSTFVLSLSDWADEFTLPMGAPLQSVTSVQYYDTAGALQTLSGASYLVDTQSEPGRVLRAPGVAYPGLQNDRRGGRVLITYVCGWTSADAVPEAVKQGMRYHVAANDMSRSGADLDAVARAARLQWDAVGRVFWGPLCA